MVSYRLVIPLSELIRLAMEATESPGAASKVLKPISHALSGSITLTGLLPGRKRFALARSRGPAPVINAVFSFSPNGTTLVTVMVSFQILRSTSSAMNPGCDPPRGP